MICSLIDSIKLDYVHWMITIFSVLISITGTQIFSMTKNPAHRIFTLILAFAYFEGVNIYFSILWLKSLNLKVELWWFSISLAFTAVYFLCVVQSSIFHLVLIRYTCNETEPRLPNIQFKTHTQWMLIVLLCFCGILATDDAIFLRLTIPVLLLQITGILTLLIHREECWLADKICRVWNYIAERPGIRYTMMCVLFLINFTKYNSLISTDNVTISNAYNLDDVQVPTDVLYIRKIDQSLILRAYCVLSMQETFMYSVYEKLLN